jgi:hypothetical protein
MQVFVDISALVSKSMEVQIQLVVFFQRHRE